MSDARRIKLALAYIRGYDEPGHIHAIAHIRGLLEEKPEDRIKEAIDLLNDLIDGDSPMDTPLGHVINTLEGRPHG